VTDAKSSGWLTASARRPYSVETSSSRHHQGVVEKVDARDQRAFDASDHHVEVVKRARGHQSRGATLRRTRVDVVELLEACRIFQVAEQRQAMLPNALWSRPLRQRSGRARQAIERNRRRCHGRGAGLQERSAGQTHAMLRAAFNEQRCPADYVGFSMDDHRRRSRNKHQFYWPA
jgi:hypothetical protein